jgi:hypothetical protein
VCAARLKYSYLKKKKKIYKMQHLEGSGTPVLYIGRTVLKGQCLLKLSLPFTGPYVCIHLANCTMQNLTKEAKIPHPVKKYSEFYGT